VTVLVAAGGAVLEDTRTDAERSGMQNSMAAFSSKASLVGLGVSVGIFALLALGMAFWRLRIRYNEGIEHVDLPTEFPREPSRYESRELSG